MKRMPFMLILIFAFVVGCTTSTSKPKEIDVFVGVQGLAAEFAKTAPPPRVFESSNFPILLRISNKGAFSIKNKEGVISIGMEKDYVNGLNVQQGGTDYSSDGLTNQVYYDIGGKTQINPKGDEIVIPMSAKTGKLDPQSETRTSTITATLCYPYKTTLSTTVCIDPDAAGIRPGKKVCNVKEIAFSSGQGAPIAVTKIEPQMIPELDQDIVKPQFLIFIENKGLGNPVDINNYHNVCGKSDFGDGTTTGSTDVKNIWNAAFLKAYSSGNNQLVCCPNLEGKCDETNDPVKMTGFIRFRDKKDFVRCTLKEGISKNSDAYTSPLRVEIDYGYVQTYTSNFIIQKPLKY